MLLGAFPFQLWFTVLEFLALVSGESHFYITPILSPSVPGSADQMTGQPQSCRGFISKVNHTSFCIQLSLTSMPVSLLACLPAYQFASIGCVSVCKVVCPHACLSHMSVSTCLFSHLSIPLLVFVLDRVCLPAFIYIYINISLSVPMQPNLDIVSSLSQSVTDLWTD